MLAELADLYRNAVKHTGAQKYTDEQVRAWATAPDNEPRFRQFIEDSETLVAVDQTGSIAGFCGLKGDGHLNSLYVAAGFQRMGIGSRLLNAQIEKARSLKADRLYTEASEFSRGTFLKAGFIVAETEKVIYNGARFERYKMIKKL